MPKFRVLRRTIVALGVVALHALVLPSVGSAALEVSSRISPERVVFGATPRIEYRIELQAGDAPERLFVIADRTFSGAAFAVPELGRAPEGRVFGRPEVRAEGALSLDYVSAGPMASRVACGRHVAYHGSEEGVQDVGASLPAGGRGAIVYDAPLGADAPWGAGDLGLRFVVSRRTAEGTVTDPVATSTPALPELAGPRGVKIVMRSRPALQTADSDGPVDVAGDVPITFAGHTAPPLPGEFLTLREARDEAPPRVIGRARIDDSGRFRFADYRPQRPGRYEVWATYESTRPDLADDRLCPLEFRLTSAGPSERFARVAASRRSRRRLRVRVACPSGTAACRGTLRVARRGGQPRGASRTYSVRAGRPRTYTLREAGEGAAQVEVAERSPRRVRRRFPLR